jgi:hypothetical protein
MITLSAHNVGIVTLVLYRYTTTVYTLTLDYPTETTQFGTCACVCSSNISFNRYFCFTRGSPKPKSRAARLLFSKKQNSSRVSHFLALLGVANRLKNIRDAKDCDL